MRLRGVTLVYGPPGAGKTTFAAHYVYHNYDKVFWVSAFEDEATFRSNMSALGYNFGEELVYWEAPLADPEPFFDTLVNSVIKERPGALVIDSITEFLGNGNIDIIHNVVYRVIKQSGIDVFVTAEKEVAEKVAYVADNVIELVYDVRPYGAYREMVVRKIRGGRAGYAVPYIIAEGLGFVLFKTEPSEAKPTEPIETGTCLDIAAGGLYRGVLHAVVGHMGSGKTWLMLKATNSLAQRGKKVAFISIMAGGQVYAGKFGVPAVGVDPNLEELLTHLYKMTGEKYDAVFIRGLELMKTMYGKESLYVFLKVLHNIAKRGTAFVISLRSVEDFDMFFDVIIETKRGVINAARAPGGQVGVDVQC